MLLNPSATFDLARRLQQGSAPIGEVFAFISGLYFRGKLAYAERFAHGPEGAPGALIITAGWGLVRPDTPVSAADFRELASIPIDLAEQRYLGPFQRDALNIAGQVASDVPVILLGSIATPKYVSPLLAAFGARLLFPVDFVGRGDMSRGGLMLRSASAGEELAYASVESAVRHGKRPPRLPPRNPGEKL